MSITIEGYVKRAEECERLAGACISESNRQILLSAAAQWRRLAEANAGAIPAPPSKAMEGSGGLDGVGSEKGERGAAAVE